MPDGTICRAMPRGQRIKRTHPAVRRGRFTAAVPSDDRPRGRRHRPARRGLRSRGRLSDRARPRHHLRDPGVGVPDRRPGPRLPGDRLRPPRPRPQRPADAPRELRPELPCRRSRRRPRGDAEARRTCGHRGPLHGRHRDQRVVRTLSPQGDPARGCRRPDQHHHRGPAAARQVGARAADADRRQGAHRGGAAEELRCGAAAARCGPARANGSCR